MFEKYNFDGVNVAIQAVLTLYAQGMCFIYVYLLYMPKVCVLYMFYICVFTLYAQGMCFIYVY